MEIIKGNAVTYTLENDNVSLIHVCNNKRVMGAGIALEIKQRIPSAYGAYKQHGLRIGGDLPLGTVSTDAKVFNMVAQDGFGTGMRHLNYGALSECLTKVGKRAGMYSNTIALPYKMGADRAGGDWGIVLEMVEWHLKDYGIVVCKL